ARLDVPPRPFPKRCLSYSELSQSHRSAYGGCTSPPVPIPDDLIVQSTYCFGPGVPGPPRFIEGSSDCARPNATAAGCCDNTLPGSPLVRRRQIKRRGRGSGSPSQVERGRSGRRPVGACRGCAGATGYCRVWFTPLRCLEPFLAGHEELPSVRWLQTA